MEDMPPKMPHNLFSVPMAGAHPPFPQEAPDAAHRKLHHTAGTGIRHAFAGRWAHCWSDDSSHGSVNLEAGLCTPRHPLLLAISLGLAPPTHAGLCVLQHIRQ